MRIWNQFKFVGSFVVAIILAVIADPSPAQRPERAHRSEPSKILLIETADYQIRAGDSELQRLLKSRLLAAITEWKLEFEQFRTGKGRMDDGVDVGRRILEARLSLATSPAEQLTIRQQYVEYARSCDTLNQLRCDAGALRPGEFERTKYFRIDAEIQVLRLGATLPGEKAPASAAPAKPARAENGDPPPDPSHLTEFVKVTPFAIDPAEPLLRRLLKERANLAITEVRIRNDQHLIGREGLDHFLDSGRRARDSRLQLASTPEERLQILKQYLDFIRAIYELVLERYRVGAMKHHILGQARYDLLCAEISHFRARASAEELTKLQIFAPADGWPPAWISSGENVVNVPEFVRAKLYVINDTEPELQRLPKRRMNIAIHEVSDRFQEFVGGQNELDTLLESGHRARDARLQLANDEAQSREILTQYFGFTKAIEKLNQERFDKGTLRQRDLERSRYERLSAEIDLLRAKAK